MADEDRENMNTDTVTIEVGDRVMLLDKNVEGNVTGIREFGGKKTYVVHTEKGNQVVVGLRQIEKLS